MHVSDTGVKVYDLELGNMDGLVRDSADKLATYANIVIQMSIRKLAVRMAQEDYKNLNRGDVQFVPRGPIYKLYEVTHQNTDGYYPPEIGDTFDVLNDYIKNGKGKGITHCEDSTLEIIAGIADRYIETAALQMIRNLLSGSIDG